MKIATGSKISLAAAAVLMTLTLGGCGATDDLEDMFNGESSSASNGAGSSGSPLPSSSSSSSSVTSSSSSSSSLDSTSSSSSSSSESSSSSSLGDVGEFPPSVYAFVDNAVEGLQYICGINSGMTNAEGKFKSEEGSGCTFMVGQTSFSVSAAKLHDGNNYVTPYDIYENTQDAINLARMLQTLDGDGNPDNGITISDTVHAAVNIALDFSQGDADFTTALQGVSSNTPVSAEDAMSHLQETMLNLGLSSASSSSISSSSSSITSSASSSSSSSSSSSGTPTMPPSPPSIPAG